MDVLNIRQLARQRKLGHDLTLRESHQAKGFLWVVRESELHGRAIDEEPHRPIRGKRQLLLFVERDVPDPCADRLPVLTDRARDQEALSRTIERNRLGTDVFNLLDDPRIQSDETRYGMGLQDIIPADIRCLADKRCRQLPPTL